METVFLGCFVFGALFTVVSVLIGFAHATIPGLDQGHFGHIAHVGHVGHDAPHVPAGHGMHALGGDHTGAHSVGHGQATPSDQAHVTAGLPLLNASSLLAFVTWFGAAGYIALRFGSWPLIGALAGALGAGLVGGAIIGAFLGFVLSHESELNPRDFTMEGTIARVTISIPEKGAGEIVYSMGGTRRSSAARSLSGASIPRNTEVVVIDYERGIASVQPWDEFVPRGEQRAVTSPETPSSSSGA